MSSSCQPQRAAASIALAFCLVVVACARSAPAAEFERAFNFDPRLSGIAPTFTFASLMPFEMPPSPRPAVPFAATLSPPVKGGLQRKWLGVLRKLPHERKILAHCRAEPESCPQAAERFLAVIQKAMTREGITRIAEINRAINLDIRPVDDMTQYHVVDLWATPLMTFASNAGDCEDYAIAKYVALQEIGIADEDIRLLVVHLRANDENHAVVAVRYQGRWLILDNRTLELRDDGEIAEFDPLFVLDGESVRRMAVPTALAQDEDGRRVAATASVARPFAAVPRDLPPFL